MDLSFIVSGETKILDNLPSLLRSFRIEFEQDAKRYHDKDERQVPKVNSRKLGDVGVVAPKRIIACDEVRFIEDVDMADEMVSPEAP